MTRRFWLAALVAATMLIGLAPAAAATTPPPLPNSMAAVGDSITQAASTGGSLGTDYPANSWSTGTNSTVNSHYLRLLALNSGISGKNYNRSVSGAKMADLAGQMQTAAALQPDYLTVLIGGNDLCTDTAVQMTEVIDFRAQFETAMATLASGSPNTNIYLSSIPNVYHLWELFKGNWWARFIWSAGGVCQSLLANPTSTNQTDVDRRASVAQRNVDYNTALAEVCVQYARCLWDGNIAYTTVFTSSDVSGDYFHPSTSGQAKLAAVSWGVGYWAGGAPPPPPPPPTNQAPTASFTYSCTYLVCPFDGSGSSDPDGSIASYVWTFGVGSASGVTPSHTFSAAGTYLVSLVVTDNEGATGYTEQSVTVSAPPVVQTMTISALIPSSATRKGGWTATVTITVRDGSGATLSGATVTGAWSGGEASSCTTGSSGTCPVSVNVGRKTSSVTWTVSNVTKAAYTYVPGSLTSVPVYRP